MLNIGFQKAMLFFWIRVCFVVECVGCSWAVVVVAPLREVVCKFETSWISGSVFEVNDNKPFVFVSGKEEGRFARRFKLEKIAILGVVVSKDELFLDRFGTAVLFHKPFAISLDCSSENKSTPLRRLDHAFSNPWTEDLADRLRRTIFVGQAKS